MLETLFGSKSSEQVLSFLVEHPEGYASRIAQERGLGLFAAQKQLGRFEEAGILLSRVEGRKRIYALNPDYPLLDPLRQLIQRALSLRSTSVSRRISKRLPKSLREFFWDYPFSQLTWERDRDFIMRRLLTVGSWDAITWLRRRAGDEALRDWFIAHRGRGLSARQLRFWALILDLPRQQVNVWVKAVRSGTWSRR